MHRKVTNEEVAKLQARQKKVLEEVKETLGPAYPLFSLRWSQQLTRAIGRVTWGSKRKVYPYARVSLSTPIFFGVITEKGIEAAKEELEITLKHELAHVLTGEGVGHGPQWVNACKRLGTSPTVCHGHSNGKALFSNKALRKKFPPGAEVTFTAGKGNCIGIIVKHCLKRIHISITSPSRYKGYIGKVYYAQLDKSCFLT